MFSCDIVNENETTLILAEGELAYDVCQRLKDLVFEYMRQGVSLSFDMAGVTFLDCAGAGLLAQLRTLTDRWSGSFELQCLQANVMRMLKLLSLTDYLNANAPETPRLREACASN